MGLYHKIITEGSDLDDGSILPDDAIDEKKNRS